MKKRILTLLLVSVLLLTMMAFTLVSCKKDKDPDTIPPDYAPPPEEEGAEDIEGEEEEKLEVVQNGGAVGLTYSDKITIDLSEKKATLRFDNPSRSVNSVVLQLKIGDLVVFETGTLAPGKRITSMDVADSVLAKLQAGTYTTATQFHAYFYDPNTNERAIVHSEIAVTVTVQP